METKTVFRFFGLWEDEKEEAWLGAMARQGWHLKKIGFINRYVFEGGPPRDVAYGLDFKPGRSDKQNYLQLFADAGWEHVLEYGSWQYFRKETAGEDLSIFTDNDSKTKKYQRLLAICVVFLMIWWQPSIKGLEVVLKYGWLVMLVFVLRLALFIMLLYTVIMLMRRIFQLRKKI